MTVSTFLLVALVEGGASLYVLGRDLQRVRESLADHSRQLRVRVAVRSEQLVGESTGANGYRWVLREAPLPEPGEGAVSGPEDPGASSPD